MKGSKIKTNLRELLSIHGFAVDENDVLYNEDLNASIPFEELRKGIFDNDVYNGHIDAGRRIVCAANRNIETGEIAMGIRHFCMMMHGNIDNMGGTDVNGRRAKGWLQSEQGFLDNYGKFLDREEAWKVAEAAGQIVRKCSSEEGVLYSENLY